MDYHSAQAFFWRPITQDYWTIAAVVSALGAVFLFKSMVRDAAGRKQSGKPTIDAVMIARLGLLGGLIMTSFIPMNSGLQAWAVGSFAFAGFWFGLLLETRWCSRYGSPRERLVEIGKEYVARLSALGHRRAR